jgi:sulfur-oxidizing protein SoxA
MSWHKKGLRWLVSAVALTGLAVASGMAGHAEIPLSERQSGYANLGPETKGMQDDDTINPATLWVLDGEALWSAKAGSANLACSDCHGTAGDTMKGVAARYPAYDTASKGPVDLEQRINICRTDHQKAPPFRPESKDLLSLAAFVARQSRGMPIAANHDARLNPFIAAGSVIFRRRQGQLNLSCAQCHEERWGKHLGSSLIPQAQPTGYPIYRLEWQSLGSLQRRLRNCMIGMRAEPYAYGAPEDVNLELFLMWRARGMKVESPAVRP